MLSSGTREIAAETEEVDIWKWNGGLEVVKERREQKGEAVSHSQQRPPLNGDNLEQGLPIYPCPLQG